MIFFCSVYLDLDYSALNIQNYIKICTNYLI